MERKGLHRIEVSPRNACGICCFVPMVRMSHPRFRIKELPNKTLSVRLNVCGDARECTSCELNDVWRLSADGAIVTSMKTRGHVPCGKDFCVCANATGPALFVAVDPSGPTLEDIRMALLE